MHGLYAQAHIIPRVEKKMYFDRSDDPKYDNHILKDEDMTPTMTNHIKTGSEPDDMYAKGQWRSRWHIEKELDDDSVVINYGGFQSDAATLKLYGWDIKVEYNRFMGTYKLALRRAEDGIMCRIPYKPGQKLFSTTKMYAVKNYKIKAAKYKEIMPILTQDMIPFLLEWIRSSMKEQTTEIILKEKKEAIKTKIVELGDYLRKAA